MVSRTNTNEVLLKVDGVEQSSFVLVTNSMEILQENLRISVVQVVKC